MTSQIGQICKENVFQLFLEAGVEVLLNAREDILVSLVALSLDEKRAGVEVFAIILPHVSNDRLVKHVTAQRGPHSQS